MAVALNISVETRDPGKNRGTGSRASQKLRAAGRVPAILYGHKLDPTPISLAKDDVLLMLKKQAHLAELKLDGGRSELAVVRDVQWDYLGKEIIHLDFVRVDADETVISDVTIELAGEAPALSQGGLVEQNLHHLKIRAKPNAIPRSIRVDISGLAVGHSVHVRDLALPEGVTVPEEDLELLVVHATERKGGSESTAAEGAEDKKEG